MNTLWFTEINFYSIPTYEGSFPVPDTVFYRLQGFSELYTVIKKRLNQLCCDKKKTSENIYFWFVIGIYRNENNYKKVPRDRNID